MSYIDPEYARLLREQTEAREQRAHAVGQLDATIEAWAREAENVELLRGLAWARTGLVFGMKDGKLTRVPPGWPEGVDGGAFVADWVKAEKAKHAEPGSPRVDEMACAVIAFRARLAR